MKESIVEIISTTDLTHTHRAEDSLRYLHRFSREACVHVLLEVWVFGCQVSEVRWFVLVTVPRMHGLIQSHY